jgi:hypothetical protein
MVVPSSCGAVEKSRFSVKLPEGLAVDGWSTHRRNDDVEGRAAETRSVILKAQTLTLLLGSASLP